MTRNRDIALSLDARVNTANRARPDLFISVHANAEPSRRRRGAMTLYPDDGPRDGRPDLHGRAKAAARSRTFSLKPLGAGGPVGKAAQLAVTCAAFEIYRVRSIHAARIIQASLAPVTGTVPRDNGVIEDHHRGLRVLRNTHAPAVIVEVDFLSNRQSERKLKRASYRTEIARAMGRAVVNFRKRMEEE